MADSYRKIKAARKSKAKNREGGGSLAGVTPSHGAKAKGPKGKNAKVKVVKVKVKVNVKVKVTSLPYVALVHPNIKTKLNSEPSDCRRGRCCCQSDLNNS